MARDGTNIKLLVDEVGGLPAIIKLLRGTQGVGVMIATTMKEVATIFETFWLRGASSPTSRRSRRRSRRARVR